jgi:hypothetical protein
VDLSVSGGRQLTVLAENLHTLVQRGMRPALDEALAAGAGHAVVAARRNAQAILPRRGGYAAEVAASPIVVDSLHGVASAVVRVTAKGHDPRLDTQGRLRHPVFGRDQWREQRVPAGWFTTAMIRSTADVEARLLRAVDAVLARV